MNDVGDITLTGTGERFPVAPLRFMPAHDLEPVRFPRLEVISGVLFERVVLAQVLSAGAQRFIFDHPVRIFRSEVIIVQPTTVSTIFYTDAQTFQGHDIGIDVIVKLVVVGAVLLHVGLKDGVAVISTGIIDFREAIRAVRIARRNIGKLVECRVDHVVLRKGDDLLRVGVCRVEAHLQPVGDVGVKVGTEAGAGEARAYTHTVLIEIAATQGVVHVLVTAIDVHRVVLHEGRLEEFVLPVGAVGEQRGVFIVFAGAPALNGRTHIIELRILRQVHHTEFLGEGLPADIPLILYFGLAVLSPLGGDHHHTIGSTRTVDGRGRSVFQHLNGGDVRRVDTGQHTRTTRSVAARGDTVDNIQRLVAIQGVDTANLHGDATTRRTGVLHHLHTGYASLHGLLKRSVDTLLDGIFIDRSHRTGEVGTLHHTIAHDDNVVKRLRIFAHGHIQTAACGHFGCERGITDIRKFQCLSGFGVHGIVTVKVGNGSRSPPFNFHCHSDDWLSATAIRDRTGHFDLCKSRQRKQQHKQ